MKNKTNFLSSLLLLMIVLVLFACSDMDLQGSVLSPEMEYVYGATFEGTESEGVFITDRTVTLKDFWMGIYEVTQEEYESVMENQTGKLREKNTF